MLLYICTVYSKRSRSNGIIESQILYTGTYPPLTEDLSSIFLFFLRYKKASLLGVLGLCTSWLYRFSSKLRDLLSDRGDIPLIHEPGVPGVRGVTGPPLLKVLYSYNITVCQVWRVKLELCRIIGVVLRWFHIILIGFGITTRSHLWWENIELSGI